MWWVGGFYPNNQATSWPNLHAQDKQDFNSSWNWKLGPSVAKMYLTILQLLLYYIFSSIFIYGNPSNFLKLTFLCRRAVYVCSVVLCIYVQKYQCCCKECSKLLSFERHNSLICIPIGCDSVRTFVLANSKEDLTLVHPKRQYLSPLFDIWCN